MALVTSDTGWVLSEKRLLWTDSFGESWRDITPHVHDAQVLETVFFLDALDGWVIVRVPLPDFDMCRVVETHDGGNTWSTVGFDPGTMPAIGSASVYFLDAAHGWIMLRLASSANFDHGLLWRTADGGATWEKLPNPPAGDPVRFISAQDGWLAGGPGGDQLFATNDGGRTWARQDIASPSVVFDGWQMSVQLPSFTDGSNAILPVTLTNGQQTTILYESGDGGKTWRVPRDYTTADDALLQRAAGSTRWNGSASSRIRGMEAVRETLHAVSAMAPTAVVNGAHFVDGEHGWVLALSGSCAGFKTDCWQQTRLFSTRDHGSSLKDITPASPSPSTAISPLAVLGPPVADIGGVVGYGFDTCSAPTTTDMSTLYYNSPYRSTAIYIGGENRACAQPNLTSNWVRYVRDGTWALIPAWVGPQLYIYAYYPEYGYSLISLDPGVASSQGIREADKAAAAGAALGLTKTTFFYVFDPSWTCGHPSPCGDAARAFIDGWVSEMHSLGNLAGVYDASWDAYNAGWQTLPHVPDVVWLKWIDNRASVWGLEGMPDGLWYNHQRIHQYTATHSASYGGVVLNLSDDYTDAPLAITYSAAVVTKAAVAKDTSADLVGNVNPNRYSTNVWFEWGTSATLATYSSTAGQVLSGSIYPSDVTNALTGLTPRTTYYYRAAAAWTSSPSVVARANIVSFTTLPLRPTVTTSAPSGITPAGATLRGTANPNGGPGTAWFEWGTDPQLATYNSTPGQSLGSPTYAVSVSATLAALTSNTTYYYRVVGSNGAQSWQTTRGAIVQFKTTGPPVATTLTSLNVTATGATLNGSVVPDGLATSAWFEWGTSSTLTTYSSTVAQSEGSGANTVTLTAALGGLTPATTYYFRAVASNSAGTTRGTIVSFLTAGPPIVTTSWKSNITQTTAKLGGSVNPNALATDAWFEWGTSSTLETYASTTPQVVTLGISAVTVTADLSGLIANTTYYFRVAASNSEGTARGTILSFITLANPPAVTTSAASAVGETAATLNGSANPNGVTTNGWFEWGTSSTLDSYSRTPNQAIGSGTSDAPLSVALSGLSGDTTYYYRAAASSSGGTTRATILSFKTLARATAVSVTPNSGSGLAQSFAFQYWDGDGSADLTNVYVIFNTLVSGANACYVRYNRPNNLLYLANDAGSAWQSGIAPGVSGTVSNSQCTVNAAASSTLTSGNTLTVSLALTFATAFSGVKNVYLRADDAVSNSGWVVRGTWSTAPNQPPTAVSVTPGSGSGASQTFNLLYSDPNGYQDLVDTHLLMNTSVNGANACYVRYNRPSNTVYVTNDAGTAWQAGITLGVPGTVSNSQCTVNAGDSSILTSGNTSTVNLALTFATSFSGAKNVYLRAADAISNSGWVLRGTWSTAPNQAPSTVSVTPNSGSGASQTFNLLYSDPNGYQDLVDTHLLINAAMSAANACYVRYNRPSNTVYVTDDAGTAWQSGITLGAPGTVSNSQCTVNAGASSILTSGNTLTVNLALTFATAFSGAKNVYLRAADGDSNSGWVLRGTWTTASNQAPSAVSVTPNSGSGASQTFGLLYSDPNGYQDLVDTHLLINAAMSGANACYVRYNRSSNTVYVTNDAGTAWQAGMTLGVLGTVSNSQCTVNAGASSILTSGNLLTVNLAVTFAPGFTGTRIIYMRAADATSNSGWVARGTWTP